MFWTRFQNVSPINLGRCDWIQHEIHVTEGFKLARLRAYRVPESLIPEVEKQIEEMLQLGIIKASKSEMVSPIVCVLKGKDGRDGVRLAIDYRYLNRYCLGDAYPMAYIADLLQRVGQAKYICQRCLLVIGITNG